MLSYTIPNEANKCGYDMDMKFAVCRLHKETANWIVIVNQPHNENLKFLTLSQFYSRLSLVARLWQSAILEPVSQYDIGLPIEPRPKILPCFSQGGCLLSGMTENCVSGLKPQQLFIFWTASKVKIFFLNSGYCVCPCRREKQGICDMQCCLSSVSALLLHF